MEAIIEVVGGLVFLGVLAFLAIAPVKVGRPYLDGTETLGPERKDEDRF